jgi:hypothetical protein
VPMPSVFAVGGGVGSIGTALAVPIPTGTVADDVLILLHEMDPVLNAAVLGAVTGYSEVLNSPSSQTAGLPTRLTVRWHRATGPESGTVATPAVTNHQSARIIGFRGVTTTGSPWNQTAASVAASSASVSIDGLTTTVADCMILAAVTTGEDLADTARISGWANGSLVNVVERVDNWISSGTGGGIGAATGEKAAAGAVSATTATLVVANTQARFCMALQGAVAAAGGRPQGRRQPRQRRRMNRRATFGR